MTSIAPKIVLSLSVKRSSAAPGWCWGSRAAPPRSPQCLVVVVVTASEEDLIAYGIDPDHAGPLGDSFLFAERMQAADLGKFLKFLIDGNGQPSAACVDRAATLAVADIHAADVLMGVSPDTVDHPIARPPPTGPKLRSYADALRANELAMESDATDKPKPDSSPTPDSGASTPSSTVLDPSTDIDAARRRRSGGGKG